MKKRFNLLFYFSLLGIINAPRAQTVEKLVKEISTELCDSMIAMGNYIPSKKTDEDFLYNKNFHVLSQGNTLQNMILLAQKIPFNLDKYENPFEKAAFLVIVQTKKTCPISTLEYPINPIVKTFGDTICNCLDMKMNKQSDSKMRAIINVFGECFNKVYDAEANLTILKKDAQYGNDVLKARQQTLAYIESQCDVFVDARADGITNYLFRYTYFKDYFLRFDSYESSKKNAKNTSDLNVLFFNDKIKKEADEAYNQYLEDAKGQYTFPLIKKYEQKENVLIQTLTYVNYGTKTIIGNIIVHYDKNALGKIKKVVYVAAKDIKNIEKYKEELLRVPPPPPPPPLRN